MSGWFGRPCVRTPRCTAVALVAACLCAAPHPATAADPYRDLSLALGQRLLALFPPLEGYVVSSSGDQIYVDVAHKDLVRPGMELQIYRPGAEMVHPVTKQVLGSYEQDLGALSVTEVRENYSRGTLDAAGAAAGIVPGDRVRISSRRLRTLLHVAGAAGDIEVGPLAQALIARGEQSGRFAMIDEPAWAPALASLGAPWEIVRADPDRLRRLGELAAADLLLLTRIESGAGPGVVIEVRSLRTGTMLGELSERWPAPSPAASPAAEPAAAVSTKATKPSPAVPAPPPAAPAEAPPTAPPALAAEAVPAAVPPGPGADEYIVRELARAARCLAAGDVLGEGRLEVILTDGAMISLFRWEGESLAWKWDEEARGGRRILGLDAADFDGDGRAEVLVAVFRGGRVTSEIRRWQDGALQIAATIDGVYLRAAPRSGAPPLLLGQRAGIDEVLTGRVEQYRLSEASLERVEGSALPAGVGIFGLALTGPGAEVLLYALDRAGHISGLTAAGARAWRSKKPYGGYPPPLTSAEFFGFSVAEERSFDEEARAFQGRLLAEQSPGRIRLVVPRNFSDSLLVLARQHARGKGELVILEGPPAAPEELLRSRVFEGYVADLARADIDGDGNAEILFVVNHQAGILEGERGKLVVWRPRGTPEQGKLSP